MTLPKRVLVFILAVIVLSAPAAAHVGIGNTAGFLYGIQHPLGGLDHIVAMVAVGLFAVHLGGRAVWLVPASFVLMMAAGGMLGASGIAIPWVEMGIALSIVVLGSLIALQIDMPVALAMSLVGGFAIFHGHAHGAEMPATSSGVTYALGFMLATVTLHITGIAVGLAVARLPSPSSRRLARLGGGAMALAGMALAGGAL
ncbi:HupE/UreJ family protein [soil metagenome]